MVPPVLNQGKLSHPIFLSHTFSSITHSHTSSFNFPCRF